MNGGRAVARAGAAGREPTEVVMDEMLPTIKMLEAFAACVQTGSISAAARKLDASQPALSQRLRALEDLLGCVLFARGANRLVLTEGGRAYYQEVAPLLDALRAATAAARARARQRRLPLTVAAHFGFAHLVLLPLLDELGAAFPALDFQVVPDDDDASPTMRAADLTIRCAGFADAGEHERPLYHEEVFPVCSPGFAERYGLSRTLDTGQLYNVPVLHMDYHDRRWLDWSRWCDHAGLTLPQHRQRFAYRNYPLLLAAAERGEGLCLGWAVLVREALARGRLLALGPAVRHTGRGYLIGARRGDSAVVGAVRDWFRRRAARDPCGIDDAPAPGRR